MGRVRSKKKLQLWSASSRGGGGVLEAREDAGAQRDLLTCSKSNYAGYLEPRLRSRSELLSRQAQQS